MSLARGWFRRVRYVPQLELAECGAACLAMIAGYHGRHIGSLEARQLCGVTRDGATLYSIAKAAQQQGLGVRAYRIQGHRDLATAALPAIAHWDGNHFVVVAKVGRREVVIVDPAIGRRRLGVAEFDARCAGVVLTFERRPDFAPRRRPRPSLARYARVLRRVTPAIAIVLAATFLLELLGMLFPAAGQILVDSLLRDRQERLIRWFALVLGATTLLKLLLTFVRDRIVHVLHHQLDIAFMGAFLQHLVRLPIGFFQQRTVGDLMERVNANVELRSFTSQMLLAVLDSFLVLGYGALMLAYDLRLGSFVILASALRVLVVALLQRQINAPAAAERACLGRESSILVEALSMPEVSKAFGLEGGLLQRYGERLIQRLNAASERRRISDRVGQSSFVIDGVMLAGVLVVGGDLVLRDQMTFGVFAAFLTLHSLLMRPMHSLLAAQAQFELVESVLTRLDDIWEAQPEARGGVDPGLLRGHIRLSNVCFSYGSSAPKILDGISLEIQPGEKVAIVGPSGAGKSTLARLLLGLELPTEGCVQIDGRDLRDLDLQRLRSQIGVVQQEAFLFDASARTNLALWDPALPLERLEQAARIACIDDTLHELPQGYETPLGERGRILSGGQRQRVAVARAIAHRPGILLLDEATSALDLETEARLHAGLRRLSCTRVVIAHRLATVRDADRIYVLAGGRIVQAGAFDTLAREQGLFRELLEAVA